MKKTGILLVNLGSPSAPTKKAVRSYLKEFLSDQRLIDLPRWQWLPILHGIILNTRPKKVAKLYQNIWGQQSPLIETCCQVTEQLNSVEQTVKLAMRYGSPAIDSVLEEFDTLDHLIVLPLFPQFCSATTASIFDKVNAYYKNKRQIPKLTFVRDYHDHPLYIEALANSLTQYWQKNTKAEKLVISFHGVPQRYIDEGDCYQSQCQTTTRLLIEKLGLKENQWVQTFQSRFGKEPWLTPYTDEVFEQLAQEGIKTIDVISPGFSADCLETLEELAITGQEQFVNAGGKSLHYIPALNTDVAHIELLQSVVNQSLNQT